MKAFRRAPWRLVAVLLTLAALPLAWHYRPLTDRERRLVGTWEFQIEWGFRLRVDLMANRVFSEGGSGEKRPLPPLGTWRVSGDKLIRRHDKSLIETAKSWWRGRPLERVSRFVVEEDGTLSVDAGTGAIQKWVRLKNESHSSHQRPAVMLPSSQPSGGSSDLGPAPRTSRTD